MLHIINGIGIPGRIIPALLADLFIGILNASVVLGAIAGNPAILLDRCQELW
jgi:hypothetical protein